MDDVYRWLDEKAPDIDRALAAVFAGWDAETVLILIIFAAAALGILVMLMVPRRVLGVLVAAVIVTPIIAAAEHVVNESGYYKRCEDTRGTTTYQFADEPDPKAQTSSVRRCQTRLVGTSEWSGWSTPYIVGGR